MISAVLVILMGCSAPTASSSLAGSARLGTCGGRAAGGESMPRWVSRYDGPGHFKDFASAEVVSPDGRTVFVTGRSSGKDLMADYATVAYDAVTGSRLWVSRYNGPAGGPDFPVSMAISPDGSAVFVTGVSGKPPYGGGIAYATVAYSAATGNELWARQYAAGDYRVRIAVSPDGRTVIVVGDHQVTFGRDYAVTVAYDAATGTQLWARRYRSPGAVSDVASAVAATGHAVFVAGTSIYHAAPDSATTVAYDLATGARLWAGHYRIRRGGAGLLLVTVSPDGRRVVVAGEFGPNRASTFGAIAYDSATGARRWAAVSGHDRGMQEFSGSAPDYTLALSPDGRTLFVEGYDVDVTGSGQDEFATAAFAAQTGRQMWTRRFGAPQTWAAHGQSIAVSPDGRTVYAMGSCVRLFKTAGYGLVAYRAATGVQLWASTYPAGVVNVVTPYVGVGAQVVVSPDGRRLFIIGNSGPTKHNQDFLTVAYRA